MPPKPASFIWAPVYTATTPGTLAARLVSIDLMRACAYGERTTARCAMPGRTMSSVYLAWPVMSRGSSRRLMPDPKMRDAMAVLLSARHLRGGVGDRGDDVLVAGAAAEVALDSVADLRLRGLRVALQQVHRVHEHAGRAEAALQAVLLPER